MNAEPLCCHSERPPCHSERSEESKVLPIYQLFKTRTEFLPNDSRFFAFGSDAVLSPPKG